MNDASTARWLDRFEWGQQVTLVLLSTKSPDGGSAYSILSAEAALSDLVPAAPSHRAAAIVNGGRFFSGERRIRLLSVLVELNGHVPEYAGATRAEREAWAVEQRRFMSEVYRFSTYGKIGFSEEASRVVTADLGSVELGQTDCSQRGFEIAQKAAALLNTRSESAIDGILYYQPQEATPRCGSNGVGTLGVCYVGLLANVNRNGDMPPCERGHSTRAALSAEFHLPDRLRPIVGSPHRPTAPPTHHPAAPPPHRPTAAWRLGTLSPSPPPLVATHHRACSSPRWHARARCGHAGCSALTPFPAHTRMRGPPCIPPCPPPSSAQVPVVGWGPLKSTEQLAPLLVFVAMQILEFCEVRRRRESLSALQTFALRVKVTVLVFGLGVAVAAFLQTQYNYFGPPSARVRGLFVKHTRTGNPLVDSVAEHQPANAQAYEQYLSKVYDIAPYGFALSLLRWSDANSFLILYACIAYYFSNRMARLVILLGPVASVLGGVVIGFCVDQLVLNAAGSFVCSFLFDTEPSRQGTARRGDKTRVSKLQAQLHATLSSIARAASNLYNLRVICILRIALGVYLFNQASAPLASHAPPSPPAPLAHHSTRQRANRRDQSPAVVPPSHFSGCRVGGVCAGASNGEGILQVLSSAVRVPLPALHHVQGASQQRPGNHGRRLQRGPLTPRLHRRHRRH